ncbi:hypothetical protein C8F04DRAFT_1179691 [Mycena alexandri]|uniref:Uncharacterized protein n=1 Tax=Mycena alexandri TaxID=1745969 RepID=A0AAD6XAQ7_9AGAR|nr:hypothetical protein C8F04DRAFT_1179691 [Mycena alexandri]
MSVGFSAGCAKRQQTRGQVANCDIRDPLWKQSTAGPLFSFTFQYYYLLLFYNILLLLNCEARAPPNYGSHHIGYRREKNQERGGLHSGRWDVSGKARGRSRTIPASNGY